MSLLTPELAHCEEEEEDIGGRWNAESLAKARIKAEGERAPAPATSALYLTTLLGHNLTTLGQSFHFSLLGNILPFLFMQEILLK